jgi:hypothetical protein
MTDPLPLNPLAVPINPIVGGADLPVALFFRDNRDGALLHIYGQSPKVLHSVCECRGGNWIWTSASGIDNETLQGGNYGPLIQKIVDTVAIYEAGKITYVSAPSTDGLPPRQFSASFNFGVGLFKVLLILFALAVVIFLLYWYRAYSVY